MPIHLATDAKGVELLVQAGADMNAGLTKNYPNFSKGATALHFAAMNGNAEVQTALIKAGANVNAVDHTGFTPLHLAASRDLAMADELIRAGAELEAKTRQGVVAKTLLEEHRASEQARQPSEQVYKGRLLAHGHAPYPSVPGEMSYFVDMEDANGETRSIWGPALTEALQVSGARVGDQVALYVTVDAQNVRIERSGRVAESENTIAPVTLPAASVDKEQDKAPEHEEQTITAELSVNAILPTVAKAKPVIIEVQDTMAVVRKGSAGQHKEASQVADAPIPGNGPSKLLSGRFMRDDKGDYRRIGENRVALADEGERIRFIDKQMDAFEAGVELAKSKGWEAIQVTGTEKFRAEAWFHARMEGLDVTGYEPVARDMERLEAAQSRAGRKVEVPSESMLQSKRAAENFVLDQVGGAQQANVEQGRYAGRVLHQTKHHFVQGLGRGIAVVHEKGRFSEKALQEVLQGDKNLRVQYKAGKADFGAGIDRGQRQGRSR